MVKIIDLCKKYREIIMYGFFGGLTTLINIAVFEIFNRGIHINYLLANALAWCVAVIFAYVTNKILVFGSKQSNKVDFFKEAVSFIGCRFATGFLDMSLMYIGISIIGINTSITKIFVNVVIIIVNYVLSKYLIFHTREEK